MDGNVKKEKKDGEAGVVDIYVREKLGGLG